MYKKFFCDVYILANRILFKQIVHFVRISVANYVYFFYSLARHDQTNDNPMSKGPDKRAIIARR